MKIKISLFVVLFCLNNALYSQFSVSIDTLRTNPCIDSVFQFTVVTTDGGTTVTDVNYTWSFGDGSDPVSGLDLDTVEHTFAEGGGYIVRLDAKKGTDTDYVLFKCEVALTPNFSGTKSDREEPICLGQQIFLTGKINDSTWVYEIPDENVEEDPVLFSESNPYSSVFDYRVFTKTQTVSVAADIDSVGINLEHTNLSQVKIELICPDEDTIILKDFGGPNKYFGEPIINGGADEPGVGYDYFWTNSPDYGTMNSSTPSGASLPSGSYTPDEPFSNLVGCSLNGEWQIVVTDNLANDTGFVFSNQLKFEESLLPADWEIEHTYSFPQWEENDDDGGVSSTSGAGLATAIPETRRAHRYYFRAKDDFGCPQDTFIDVTVEAASFVTDEEPEGDFPLRIGFNNITSWATELLWDFGDETETGTGDTIHHIYERDGVFRALLTASTDDGCIDTASIYVTVTIPPSQLDNIPNAFSPNNDNINDVFRLNSGTAIESLDCWIYSRWGKKVAEWHSVEEANEGWDGRINGGQEASPGVYFYYIHAVGFDGREYKEQGSFHLFR